MGDRVPFSIPGALASWVDQDYAIGVLGIAGTVVRVFMVVSDAPSGGDEVVAIRDAAAGGGSGFNCTITDGTSSSTTVNTLALTSSETVYLRVGTDNGALNLSGWFEFTPTDTTEAVTTFLTSLTRVKVDHGIGATTWDTQLSRLIQGVSAKMQSWMHRTIVDTTYTDEVHSGNGWDDTLILNHRPITSTETFVLKEDDTTVSATLYTTDDDAGLVQLKSGSMTSGRRNYKATYSAGYVGVPEDLAMAATEQVRHEFNQSQPSKTNRLGLGSSVSPTGASSAYVPGGFLPSTIEAMRPYRRVV
jgi:hypothetical protein